MTTMDDAETLHRRARLRELVAVPFKGSLKDLRAHIKKRAGVDANQGELSALQSDKGHKAFGDKKAKTLTEQIGLPRQWFAMPLGQMLQIDQWETPTSGATDTPALDTPSTYNIQALKPAIQPTLAQCIEVLALHLNNIPPQHKEAAKSMLSALVSSPALHASIADTIEHMCTGDSAKSAAA